MLVRPLKGIALFTTQFFTDCAIVDSLDSIEVTELRLKLSCLSRSVTADSGNFLLTLEYSTLVVNLLADKTSTLIFVSSFVCSKPFSMVKHSAIFLSSVCPKISFIVSDDSRWHCYLVNRTIAWATVSGM